MRTGGEVTAPPASNTPLIRQSLDFSPEIS
jgi:hypothetical protein